MSKDPIETDELKTVSELSRNGKLIQKKNAKKDEYIVVEDLTFGAYELTASGTTAKYKVMLKDIEEVYCYIYYTDLRLINPKVMRKYYVVKHKGRRVFDRLNVAQVKQLLKKNVIQKKDIHYYHIDFMSKLFVKSTKSSTPPSVEDFDKAYKEAIENYKAQYGSLPGISLFERRKDEKTSPAKPKESDKKSEEKESDTSEQ